MQIIFNGYPFFSSLNISPVTLIFSFAHHLLIKTWSWKLIRFTTSLCVPCTTMWKHLTYHYEWMSQISSFDYSTSIISLHYLYWFHFVHTVHILLIVPIYVMTMRTHLVIVSNSLLIVPIILMIVQIIFMTERILLSIQLIRMTYHF